MPPGTPGTSGKPIRSDTAPPASANAMQEEASILQGFSGVVAVGSML